MEKVTCLFNISGLLATFIEVQEVSALDTLTVIALIISILCMFSMSVVIVAKKYVFFVHFWAHFKL